MPAGLSGPRELAQLLLRAVERERQADRHLLLSEANVERLIQLAYAASLLEEEGRYPRFRIVSRTVPLRCTVEFNPPLAIDSIESLRRIAPSVSSRQRALYITQDDGSRNENLICRGIVDLGLAFEPVVGVPDSLMGHDKSSLMLAIDGPGHIGVSAFDYGFVLRGYMIRRLVPYISLEPIYQLFSSLAITILAVRESQPTGYQFFTPATGPLDIAAIWSDVLHSAMVLRHGGAFVILPEIGVSQLDIGEKYGIDIQCRTNLDLGIAIAQLADGCERVHELARDDASVPRQDRTEVATRRELKRATDQWLKQRTAVRNAASILANLSAVDGCVVLDRRLRVHGFGGIITQRGGRGLPMRQWPESENSLDPPCCRRLGTRHRSACSLCRQHSYAFAFVVSQDGDLRVFCSDSDYVYGFEGLDVWPGISARA